MDLLAFLCFQEEWVVCRVFQKSAMKKPQQTPSTLPSLDSPCDTNSIVNEFGDIELPNLNNIANSSSGFSNISPHSYNSDNNNINMNMNLNMNNWAAVREAAAASLPSLSWPSSLLSSGLSVNSLLLKALQLRNYQPRDATSTDYSYMPQGFSQFGSEHLSSNLQASSSKVLESVQQQQSEQPFNMDSMW